MMVFLQNYKIEYESINFDDRIMCVNLTHRDIISLKDVDWKEYDQPITSLDCSYNKLTSLEGCPNSVIELWCHKNQLRSLEGCPNSVTKLGCSQNKLTSLEGCPKSVTELYCFENQLTSLEGCPSSVTILDCPVNKLTSLEGCSNSVTVLYCNENQLTSLEGCPNSVTELGCSRNQISKGNDTLSYVKIHNFKKGFDITNKLIMDNAQRKIKRVWDRYWYEPNKQGEMRFAQFAFEHM